MRSARNANPSARAAKTSARWGSWRGGSSRRRDGSGSTCGPRESCPVTDDPEAIYRQTTPASRAIHEAAVRVMPGGTTRPTTYFHPYPLYIDRGEGCRAWGADGSERIDMTRHYTATILGHAHATVGT